MAVVRVEVMASDIGSGWVVRDVDHGHLVATSLTKVEAMAAAMAAVSSSPDGGRLIEYTPDGRFLRDVVIPPAAATLGEMGVATPAPRKMAGVLPITRRGAGTTEVIEPISIERLTPAGGDDPDYPSRGSDRRRDDRHIRDDRHVRDDRLTDGDLDEDYLDEHYDESRRRDRSTDRASDDTRDHAPAATRRTSHDALSGDHAETRDPGRLTTTAPPSREDTDVVPDVDAETEDSDDAQMSPVGRLNVGSGRAGVPRRGLPPIGRDGRPTARQAHPAGKARQEASGAADPDQERDMARRDGRGDADDDADGRRFGDAPGEEIDDDFGGRGDYYYADSTSDWDRRGVEEGDAAARSRLDPRERMREQVSGAATPRPGHVPGRITRDSEIDDDYSLYGEDDAAYTTTPSLSWDDAPDDDWESERRAPMPVRDARSVTDASAKPLPKGKATPPSPTFDETNPFLLGHYDPNETIEGPLNVVEIVGLALAVVVAALAAWFNPTVRGADGAGWFASTLAVMVWMIASGAAVLFVRRSGLYGWTLGAVVAVIIGLAVITGGLIAMETWTFLPITGFGFFNGILEFLRLAWVACGPAGFIVGIGWGTWLGTRLAPRVRYGFGV